MKKAFRSIPLLTTWILLLATALAPVSVHNTLRAEKKKIILLNADTIEGVETASGSEPQSCRSVIGNVRFRHGTLTLACDRATEFETEKKIVLFGNIVIIDNDVEIHADNGVYFPDNEHGELTGNVRARMLNGSLMARARKAVMENRKNRLWLYDDAIAWGKTERLSGDIIMVHTKKAAGDGKQYVDEVQVHRNTLLAARDTLSLSPVLYNQLSGNRMVISMNDRGKLSDVIVTGQAESLYHLYDEGNKPTGINYSSGNSILMLFIEGRLIKAKVTGNVEGRQYPGRYRGDPKINLPGFVRKEPERPF
ncbi:MAG: hypothetical protein K9I59_01690 [Chlorobium sp.]|uniref:LptA/OstA family protein n=1 Tax=Chlorobium sp. TaxID=1095 RepID=UPI0025B9EDFC|nr:LptA/OstA family protein [Chlorobium sp.]MCF8215541.1 hypothetical protein [Chlorobium sp.]MCF8270405.1 hypothetical protein [Chlorobium sp.]MCF8286775.1 hypothetical protein [Chlorobium sp.]MCF8290297.1 hypothetical protein [Chlorobium sp.]MCF8384456.1 hypothetical protein [Chlorobium sp.]